MKITELADRLLITGNQIHLIHWAARGKLAQISHVEIAEELYKLFTGDWYDDLMEGADKHGELLVDPNYAAGRAGTQELDIQNIDYETAIELMLELLGKLYEAYVDVHENYPDLLIGFKAVVIEDHMNDIEQWLKYKLKRWHCLEGTL